MDVPKYSIAHSILEQDNDLVAHINKVRNARAEYFREHSKQPSVNELSILIGESEKEIKDCLKYENDTISLDIRISEDEDIALIDHIEDEGSNDPELIAVNNVMKETIKELLYVLSGRERRVLMYRYCSDNVKLTYDEVGRLMGVSKQRVHQIENNALKKLRSHRLLIQFYEDYVLDD